MNSAIDVSLGMVNHLVRILIRQSIVGEQGISVERSSGSNVLLHFFLKHFTATTTECPSKWFPSFWVTSTCQRRSSTRKCQPSACWTHTKRRILTPAGSLSGRPRAAERNKAYDRARTLE